MLLFVFNCVGQNYNFKVEEEFLEPGCDDGLVCRQGYCQDIHTVQTFVGRRKRDEELYEANGASMVDTNYS